MSGQNNKAQKKGKNRTAVTPIRADDFPEWYQQVIKAADMAENSPVRGCMIIKPYGYAVWENMQRVFDDKIKELGVQNAYFPLLIPLEFISREAEHVDGFAKECAVVTHHRLEAGEDGTLVPAGKLEEPYIIRPTSETIIGDAMGRWIQSYRDLPYKLNQWCNVMRWEMRPRMFLRTSEFLWQEGHNAFENEEQARADMVKMLDAYAWFAEEYLAMPVIRGAKTTDERFPGAVETLTIEAMMQDGKALQAGTSHYLGQNFAKGCGIKFQNREGAEEFVHTTSWGISTRLIGGMIMIHGDDDGMIMPPRIAPHQAVIIPVIRDEADTERVMNYVRGAAMMLKEAGLRVHIDEREERTSNKMWNAIKKGVPLRVEIGGREEEKREVTFVRRDLGRDSKETINITEFCERAPRLIDEIHDQMLERARDFRNAHIQDMDSLAEVDAFYKDGGIGFVRLDTAEIEGPEFERIAKEHALTARCLPLEDQGEMVLVGKAY